MAKLTLFSRARWRPLLSYEDKVATLTLLTRERGQNSLIYEGERASLPFIFDVTVANLPRFTGLKVFNLYECKELGVAEYKS